MTQEQAKHEIEQVLAESSAKGWPLLLGLLAVNLWMRKHGFIPPKCLWAYLDGRETLRRVN